MLTDGVIFRQTSERIRIAAARVNQAEGKYSTAIPVWDFDPSTIFAEVNAFKQRCQDLIEVCEGQMQFASKAVVDGTEVMLLHLLFLLSFALLLFFFFWTLTSSSPY